VTKPRILVTGAAGRNASTAVLDLLGKGFPVRAFVRRQDARSEKLKQAGAEIFVGDSSQDNNLSAGCVVFHAAVCFNNFVQLKNTPDPGNHSPRLNFVHDRL